MNREQAAEAVQVDEQFIAAVGAALRANRWVRRRLPGWGRLHIDRPLPFLCIYRRPPGRSDPGTRSLVLGEASYLIASGDLRQHISVAALVREIAHVQGAAFGAFLLLEIWAQQEPAGGCPKFRIVAPHRNAPQELLESLENSLLGVRIDTIYPGVAVEYRERWAPPRLAPLCGDDELRGIELLQLGLGVPPLYRDASTGTLFPFELERLRHDLGRTLKKVFYTFTHRYTPQRPAHYHELGRHAMTPVVQESDIALAEISSGFDILLHVTPVNVADAWSEFRRRGFSREPEFHYRPRPLQPARLKRRLYRIPLERIEDPTLAAIFAAKREELDRQITLIADRGTRRFLHGSQQIYGEPDRQLRQQALQLLQRLAPVEPGDEEQMLDAAAFALHARRELEWHRCRAADFCAGVELRDDLSGLMVSRGNLLIGEDLRIPQSRVAAALAHEIGTHAFTWYSGGRQPFRQLQVGLAGYEALQEGLAVIFEYLSGGLDVARLRLLAGRVIAVHCLISGADFIETFRELKYTHGFSARSAFHMAMRVQRGGGFTKDALYLRGLVELLEHLGRGGELEPLLLGKFSLEHLPFIEELRWRRILESLPLRPHCLEMEGAAERLERLRRRPSLLSLAEEERA